MKELSGIEELINLRRKLIERADDLKIDFQMYGKQSICNRIIELNEVIDIIQKRCEEISSCDCDW